MSLRDLLGRVDRSGVPLLIARLILGGMFVWMGLAKVNDAVGFLKIIRLYHILPDAMYPVLNLMAVALPWLEILCGVLLILGIAVRGAALVLFVLLSMFTVAIFLRALGIQNAEHVAFCSISFDCGCGAGVVPVCHKLPENIGQWLLALYAMLSQARRLCLRPGLIPTSAAPSETNAATKNPA